jgi:hypothetical protein
MFLWGKLFLTSSSFHPYFLWNFCSQLGPPSNQISLNYFKLIQTNPKRYCSSGLGHPAFFSGRPTHAHAPPALSPRPLTGRPRLSVAPPPGTVPRPTRQTPRPSLFPPATRVRRTSPAHALGPLPGAIRRSGPGPTPGPPPFPSSFPLCRAAAEPLAPRSCCSTRPPVSTTPLKRPSLPTAPRTRTATSGHRQPTLPHGFWPSTATVRHSPVSSSQSYQSLQFLTIFSPICLSSAAGPHTHRRHPPEPPPHRRKPPPDAVCAASPSTRRSGAPLPSPPCPAPSP